MTEIWKAVVGFEGAYEVSNLGRVRVLDRLVTRTFKSGATATHFKKGHMLAPGPHTGGYLMVQFYADGEHDARTVHRVVMESFVGPRPAGTQILHDDGNKKNCRLDNLRYGSSVENNADKKRHGTYLFGETAPLVKLSESDVRAIRRRRGELQQELADEFGCTFSNISAIQRRKSWRHVP